MSCCFRPRRRYVFGAGMEWRVQLMTTDESETQQKQATKRYTMFAGTLMVALLLFGMLNSYFQMIC